MRKTKYGLMYAKDLSVPPGTTGNTEMVEFTSLWRALKYIVQTKPARAAVLADRWHLLKIVPKAERATQEDR
jgi:hypothetical protein